MCTITSSLKKRFCTDNNINIQLYSEPYFTDRLALFGKDLSWLSFVDMLKAYKTEEDFFAEYNKLKDAAIQYIKSSEAFESLNNEDSSMFHINTFNIPDRDTYKEINKGKKFLSVDMKKANFTCLVYYAKKKGLSFFDTFAYAEFLRQFTDNDYFVESKYIRQVIFGNCNCKRMIAYERVMMADLLARLVDANITLDIVYSLRADELIFDVTEMNDYQINILRNKVEELVDFPVDYELYTLKKFKDEDAYVKVFEDDTYEIKKVDVEDAPAVYRYMKGMKPDDLDLYFFHNGRVAKFEEQKEWILE